jgi:hypothetical protein
MAAWLGEIVQSAAAGFAAFVVLAAVALFVAADGGKQK